MVLEQANLFDLVAGERELLDLSPVKAALDLADMEHLTVLKLVNDVLLLVPDLDWFKVLDTDFLRLLEVIDAINSRNLLIQVVLSIAEGDDPVSHRGIIETELTIVDCDVVSSFMDESGVVGATLKLDGICLVKVSRIIGFGELDLLNPRN